MTKFANNFFLTVVIDAVDYFVTARRTDLIEMGFTEEKISMLRFELIQDILKNGCFNEEAISKIMDKWIK